MRVARIRKFPKKHESEITIRVNGKECEQLCHALDNMASFEKEVIPRSVYPDLVRAGILLCRQLSRDVFWNSWDSDFNK